MSRSHKFATPTLIAIGVIGVAITLNARETTARVNASPPPGEMERGTPITQPDAFDPAPPFPRVPRTASFEIAQNNEDRSERKRRDRPPAMEKRGHEQPIEVIRRSAQPIPRVSTSTTKRRPDHDRHRYRAGHTYHYRHYGYYRHVHHLHCGHDDWDYGDEFESRTLGRSCIYGAKGEVIYKPADVICASDEDVAPAAAPGPLPSATPAQ